MGARKYLSWGSSCNSEIWKENQKTESKCLVVVAAGSNKALLTMWVFKRFLCGLLDLPLRKEGKTVICTEAGLQDVYCLVRKPSLLGDQCLGPNLFHAPESSPTRCEPNGRGNTILLHQKYLIRYFFQFTSRNSVKIQMSSKSKRKSSNLSLMLLFGE